MSALFASGRVIADGTMTGTNVLTGVPADCTRLAQLSYQAVWTGTAVGAFTFEGSNNWDKDRPSDGTWTTLTLDDPPANPAGAASNWILTISDLAFRHIRLKYTNASSTGTLNVYVHAKET